MSLYSKIKVLIPNLGKILLQSILFSLALEVLKIVPPYILKLVVDELIVTKPNLSFIYTLTGAILGFSFLNTLIETQYIQTYIKHIRRTSVSLMHKTHEKLLSLDLSFHEKNPSGELVYLLNNGSAKLIELMWFINDQFIGACLQIILTSIVIMYENLTIGLVFMAFMPVVMYLLHRFGQKVQPYRQRYHAAYKEASWKMNQSLFNIRTVKDFGEESKEKLTYKEKLEEFLELSNIRDEMEVSNSRNRDLLLSFGRVSILFYVVYLVSKGSISPGSLFLIATLSEKVIASLFRLGRLYNFLGDAVESIHQLADLYDNESLVKDNNFDSDLKIEKGSVEFKNVEFLYPNGTAALTGINFKIPDRKLVAIVGKSGSGKSSIVKLLFRHYDITSGAILVDDLDIKDYSINTLRKSMAIVSQDIEVFDTTVIENIAYGLDVSMDDVIRASKMAHAHEYIEKLKEGYHTKIGERGVKLSGGQRQRLGIARALLMRPKILVFDEATSSLDTESERLIQTALTEISGEQTMIVIAHRLSTIKNADLLIVLDDGKLVEFGSYQELANSEGHFSKMLELQDLAELRE